MTLVSNVEERCSRHNICCGTVLLVLHVVSTQWLIWSNKAGHVQQSSRVCKKLASYTPFYNSCS